VKHFIEDIRRARKLFAFCLFFAQSDGGQRVEMSLLLWLIWLSDGKK
jgi:hypothetical protein